MSRRAACARADLVRALASGDAQVLLATAGALGFDPPAEPPPKRQPSAGEESAAPTQREAAPETAPAFETRTLADIPFWRVEAYEPASESLREETPLPPAEIVWANRPTEPPRVHLIAAWRDVHPRLRRSAAHIQETRVLDVAAVARQLGEGRQLLRLPYERRRRWGPYLQIIADRSERLVPYWLDQQVVGHALAATLPDHLVEVGAIWEGLAEPRLFAPAGEGRPYALPPPGTLVLVLGDLGALAAGDAELQRGWQDFRTKCDRAHFVR